MNHFYGIPKQCSATRTKFATVANFIEVAENIIGAPWIIYDWAERSNYVSRRVFGPMDGIIERARRVKRELPDKRTVVGILA